MTDNEILAMLKNDCPMCGKVDCACTATEQDQYREIQRLRLTDEERREIQWAIDELETGEWRDDPDSKASADILRGLLERLG